ncbi:MAG: VanZ family protein [bacterium]
MSRNHRSSARRRGVKSLSLNNLAGVPNAIADLPPRIRHILLIVGIVGVVMIIMESLVGRQDATIGIDKLLHFSGYAFLAAVFVLLLQPKKYLLAIGGLAAMGIVIEVLQSTTGRSPDIHDVFANVLGLGFGWIIGLAFRKGYSEMHKGLALQAANKNLRRFSAGEVIMREGNQVKDLFLIKTGKVKLEKTVDGKPQAIATMSVGDVIGVMGAILGEKQFATVTAMERTTIYRLSMDELKAEAGGREMPVSMVLSALARGLHKAGDRLVKERINLDEVT